MTSLPAAPVPVIHLPGAVPALRRATWAPDETAAPVPWRRFGARGVDLVIAAIPVFSVASALGVSESWSGQVVLQILGTAAVVPAEWLWTRLFHQTPGKLLFRLHVRRASDGAEPTPAEMMRRAGYVLVRGLALGIPVVNIGTYWHQYNTLKFRGATGYDTALGYVVTHRPIEWWRWAIIWAIIALFAAGVAAGMGA